MICVPYAVDQPLVAYRVADELGLGIRIKLKELSSELIRSSMHKIFNDMSYYERVDFYSKLSKSKKGHVEGARLILDFIRTKDSS